MRCWTPDMLKRELTIAEELGVRSERKSESKFVIHHPKTYHLTPSESQLRNLQVWATTYDKTLSKTTEFKPDWGTEAGEMW